MDLEKLRYPAGKFIIPENITAEIITEWITVLELFPSKLKEIVLPLDEEKLNWKYRPGGWTIKQVVHHCADSHINSIVRFKLALTEDTPAVKPYLEEKWAELPDVDLCPVDSSIKILEGVHFRLTTLLKSLNEKELKKEFYHPEHGRNFSIEQNIGNYAWHSNHHLEHIKQALTFKGKFE